MANGKFFHIFLRPKFGITPKQVEDKMNLSLDWFCYDTNNWVVYSISDANKLFARFQPLVEPTGSVFICELNLQNRNGWMPKALWTWLKKDRSQAKK